MTFRFFISASNSTTPMAAAAGATAIATASSPAAAAAAAAAVAAAAATAAAAASTYAESDIGAALIDHCALFFDVRLLLIHEFNWTRKSFSEKMKIYSSSSLLLLRQLLLLLQLRPMELYVHEKINQRQRVRNRD